MRKHIRKVGGALLVDDSPEEIAHCRQVGVKGFRVDSYRKSSPRLRAGELDELYRLIARGGGILGRLLGR